MAFQFMNSIYEKAKKNLIVSKLTLDYIYQNMTHDEIEQVRFEYLMKRCKKGSVTLAEGISVEEAKPETIFPAPKSQL